MPSPVRILTEDALYTLVAAELFGDGSPRRSDRIGVELELIPIIDTTDGPRMLPLETPDGGGLLAWLEELSTREGWDFECDAYRNPTVTLANGGCITVEPAGQIEYSSAPRSSVAHAVTELDDVVRLLEQDAGERGVRLISTGYNRFCRESDLELQVKKPRYRAMDEHFLGIGAFGRRMMRATCSLQVNLDFGSGSATAERWRLANMIAPSLNAIFANSPTVFEGRNYRSFRHEIWRRADPSRTGRLFDRPDLDPVADYLRFALDASVMLVSDDVQGCVRAPRTMTFRQWLNGSTSVGYPTIEDWRLHLTTLFPDVRPRGWMELRTIDSLPSRWRTVAIAMCWELFYNDGLREEALARIESRDRSINPYELEHGGAWRADFATGRELFELALDHVSNSDVSDACGEFYDRFTSRGLTPADQAMSS